MRITPMTVMTRVMASMPAVSNCSDWVISRLPRPAADRKNSAAIIPTSPRPRAWRTPVIRYGSVYGITTCRQMPRSLVRNERATSISSGEMLCAPRWVANCTGKYANRKTTITLGQNPYPSRASRNGLSATIGAAYRAIR
jgi:hypothetical protein